MLIETTRNSPFWKIGSFPNAFRSCFNRFAKCIPAPLANLVRRIVEFINKCLRREVNRPAPAPPASSRDIVLGKGSYPSPIVPLRPRASSREPAVSVVPPRARSLSREVATPEEDAKLAVIHIPGKKQNWVPTHAPLQAELKEMCARTEEAIRGDFPSSGTPEVGNLVPLVQQMLDRPPTHFLAIESQSHAVPGTKPLKPMQDAFVEFQDEHYWVAAVADGHGEKGEEVAQFIRQTIQDRFLEMVAKSKGDVNWSAKKIIHEMQGKIVTERNWAKSGSTLVLTCLDKRVHLLFVYTVGDGAAMVVRQGKTYNLSRELNWACASEHLRVEGYPETLFTVVMRGSSLYLQNKQNELVIEPSRALGDVTMLPLTHEPDSTIFAVEPEDCIVVATDGVTKVLSAETIGTLVTDGLNRVGNMLECIASAALGRYQQKAKKSDDITVVFGRVYQKDR